MPARTRMLFAVSVAALLLPACVFAQARTPADENPITQAIRAEYGPLKLNLIEGAELMPADGYGFKATPDVRTFGDLVAHVVVGTYNFCSAIQGEKAPAHGTQAEMAVMPKADLVNAIKNAFSYCDRALEGMTDAKAMEVVPGPGGRAVRVKAMIVLVSHQDEHYGTMAVYLRLKGLVPPSTARAQKGAPSI